jgi:hypothetical protein
MIVSSEFRGRRWFVLIEEKDRGIWSEANFFLDRIPVVLSVVKRTSLI